MILGDSGGILADPALDDGADCEIALDADDAGEAGELFLVDAFVIRQIACGDVEQVIGLTRHEITFPDIGAFADTGFESTKRFICQTLKGDLDDDGGEFVGRAFVDDGSVAPDDALFLKQADASEAGRRGEAHTLCQLGIAEASVVLEDAQDGFGDAVEDHDGIIGLFSHFRS